MNGGKIQELLARSRLVHSQPTAAELEHMIECLSLAVRKGKPGDGFLPDAYSNLALAFFQSQRLAEAEATLQARTGAGIALDDDGHMMLCAIVERRSGDLSAVEECYRAAVSAGVGAAAGFLASLLQKKHDFAGAARLYKKALKKARTADPALLKNYGAVLRHLGRHAAAEAQFRRVLDATPRDVAALNGLGKSQFDGSGKI